MKSVYIFIVLFLSNALPSLITSLAWLAYCLKKVNNTASNCLILTIESACNNLYSFK